MIKAVVDTSVFVAAILSKTEQSVTSKVLAQWRQGRFALVMAPLLLVELTTKLLELGASGEAVEDLVTAIGRLALHVPGAYVATRLDDIDPDDNILLAAAYESRADYLVKNSRKIIKIRRATCGY